MVAQIYFSPSMVLLLAVLIIWSVIWKGLALWRSARLKQPVWFILILVINTLGLLEIIYLFFVAKAPRPVRKEIPVASTKAPQKRNSRKRR